MHLSDLKTGETAYILKVKGHGGFRKRIIEMGFIKGQQIEALLSAPLQDPVKYKVMGYEVSLRRQEAEQIEVSYENWKQADDESPMTSTSTPRDQQHAATGVKEITIALVGNPNCGKTSLFNFASGAQFALCLFA